jgi:hypothetical protein
MPRFKLRTLLIVLAVGPMVLAWGWNKYDRWSREREAQREFKLILYDGDSTRGALSSNGNPFLWDMQNPPKRAE